MFWLSPCWPQIYTCMSCNTRTASRYVRIITNTCCVRFIIYVVRQPFRQFKSSDDKFVGGQMLTRILRDWKGCKSVSFWIRWIDFLLLPAANSSVADCSGVCAYSGLQWHSSKSNQLDVGDTIHAQFQSACAPPRVCCVCKKEGLRQRVIPAICWRWRGTSQSSLVQIEKAARSQQKQVVKAFSSWWRTVLSALLTALLAAEC